MALELGLLLDIPQDNLTNSQRALLNLFLYGGYERPITVTELSNIMYSDFETRMKIGHNLYRTLERLRVDGYVERSNNPVRYICKYSHRTAVRLAYIAKKLGFESATADDFL